MMAAMPGRPSSWQGLAGFVASDAATSTPPGGGAHSGLLLQHGGGGGGNTTAAAAAIGRQLGYAATGASHRVVAASQQVGRAVSQAAAKGTEAAVSGVVLRLRNLFRSCLRRPATRYDEDGIVGMDAGNADNTPLYVRYNMLPPGESI